VSKIILNEVGKKVEDKDSEITKTYIRTANAVFKEQLIEKSI
jgi:hypothetical protein